MTPAAIFPGAESSWSASDLAVFAHSRIPANSGVVSATRALLLPYNDPYYNPAPVDVEMELTIDIALF
jgi:hypothetical protein